MKFDQGGRPGKHDRRGSVDLSSLPLPGKTALEAKLRGLRLEVVIVQRPPSQVFPLFRTPRVVS